AKAKSVDEKCQIECFDDENPVCGTISRVCYKTFKSKCALEKYNCSHNGVYDLFYEDKCDQRLYSCDQQRDECEMNPCPLHIRPVCGFNGECYKTFSNSCFMEKEN
uniref:Kazal-like domain-containing protein n=1 Tax=Megaselia scalaris TaxID=36166 RepID=T1GQV2_MEGSC